MRSLMLSSAFAQAPVFDTALRERIDAFVESERQSSGIPGIALAIVNEGGINHVRGFGYNGQGQPISADTPFPIGSLAKSFTALLVRQAVDAGQLGVDTPVQRYLPWFQVADIDASSRITLRHLLNQTSGFSRTDGLAPLLVESTASIEELARGLGTVSLNRALKSSHETSTSHSVSDQKKEREAWLGFIQTPAKPRDPGLCCVAAFRAMALASTAGRQYRYTPGGEGTRHSS